MADIDFDRYDVHGVTPPAPPQNDTGVEWERRRRRRRQQGRPQDETQEHFPELAQLAEVAHEHLVQANSRYRFCVYERDGRVFLDVVLLDENGNAASTIQREITHQDFYDWLDRIEEEEGLLFDNLM